MFNLFIETYDKKYPKETRCLIKDKEEIMEFYDFPGKHWQSPRTTNPIESIFTTIRHHKTIKRMFVTQRHAAYDV